MTFVSIKDGGQSDKNLFFRISKLSNNQSTLNERSHGVRSCFMRRWSFKYFCPYTYGRKQSRHKVITEQTSDSPQPISDTVIIFSCCSGLS